jgi:hypothetical protein
VAKQKQKKKEPKAKTVKSRPSNRLSAVANNYMVRHSRSTDGRRKGKAADHIGRFIAVEPLSPPVHQSFMTDWWTCPRYFLWKNRYGLRLKGQRPTAADVGTFFHKAMEILAKTGGDLVSATNAVAVLYEEKKAALEKHFYEIGKPDLAAIIGDDLDRKADLGLLMARIFWKKKPLSEDRFIVLGCETTIETHIDEIKHDAQITIDQLIYCRQSGGLYIHDYKTMGQLMTIEKWRKGAEYDYQGRWYRLVLSRFYEKNGDMPIPGTDKTVGEVPVLGFLVSAMERPTIRMKREQSIDEFLQECFDYYEGRADQNPQPKQSTKKGEPAFDEEGKPIWIVDKETGEPKLYHRWDHTDKQFQWMDRPPMDHIMVRFNEPLFPDELLMIATLTGKAMNAAPTLSNFPRFGRLTKACSMMYNKGCPYVKLCSANSYRWQEIIDDDYDTGIIHGQEEPPNDEEQS